MNWRDRQVEIERAASDYVRKNNVNASDIVVAMDDEAESEFARATREEIGEDLVKQRTLQGTRSFSRLAGHQVIWGRPQFKITAIRDLTPEERGLLHAEPDAAFTTPILRLLAAYRRHPQNPKNAPMKLSDIARAVVSNPQDVEATLEILARSTPPMVEEGEGFQQERTFSITGAGLIAAREQDE